MIAVIVVGEVNREKAVSPGKVAGPYVQLETAMPPITLSVKHLVSVYSRSREQGKTT